MQEEKKTRYVFTIGSTELPELKEGLFIDKSAFIQRIINDGSKVFLFTRPRRFMKTLNLRMLYYFFSETACYKPTAGLFNDMELKNLKVRFGKDIISTYQGRYPVIWLSFKDISGNTFDKIYDSFQAMMSEVYSTCISHLEGKLNKDERSYFNSISQCKAAKSDFFLSLKWLTKILSSHHPQHEKTIILIDDDQPISRTYMQDSPPDFVQSVVDLTINLLNPVLKDNEFLEKVILTGILSIPLASSFSGLNDLLLSSLLNPQRYEDIFGFTEKEVQFLVKQSKSSLSLDGIKDWFNGYLIGKSEVYNPWAIINALKSGEFGAYWTTTGSISMFEKMLEDMLKIDIIALRNLVEGTTEVELCEEFPYTNNSKDINIIYHLLWFAGYLKPSSPIIKSGIVWYQISV